MIKILLVNKLEYYLFAQLSEYHLFQSANKYTASLTVCLKFCLYYYYHYFTQTFAKSEIFQ